MGGGQSAPNFQRRPQMEVADHMERLQRISDLKSKPMIKDGGVLELSVQYFLIQNLNSYTYSIYNINNLNQSYTKD